MYNRTKYSIHPDQMFQVITPTLDPLLFLHPLKHGILRGHEVTLGSMYGVDDAYTLVWSDPHLANADIVVVVALLGLEEALGSC